MVKVIGWYSANDIENTFLEVPGDNGIKLYKECKFDEEHKDAAVKELVEKDYVICGDTHQSWVHIGVPLFEDGFLNLSMRTWGVLMAEAANIKLGIERYNYMDFYMASTCPIEERLPERGECNV